MNFWFPHVPSWIFSLVVLIYIITVNALAVSAFGEAEYWLAIIKVLTVVLFLIVGLCVIVGIMGGQAIGFHNLTYKQAPFVGGAPTILSVFLVAGFSFQGTELVGITAGEWQPRQEYPLAIHSTFWRILLFTSWQFLSLPVSCRTPVRTSWALRLWTLPSAHSRWSSGGLVWHLRRAMNAVILTAVISAANSGMYASTRMIYSMAHEGQAWKIFGRTDKRGIPIYGLMASTLVASLTFLTGIFGPGIYEFLIDSSGLAGFLTWMGMAVAHLRFRRHTKQGTTLMTSVTGPVPPGWTNFSGYSLCGGRDWPKPTAILVVATDHPTYLMFPPACPVVILLAALPYPLIPLRMLTFTVQLKHNK